MRIANVIEALSAILEEHGDLVVMHHDDRTEFRVERVEFRPGSRQAEALLPDDDGLRWEQPPHVLISGHTFVFDGNGGLVADVERPLTPARRSSSSPHVH